jgi:kynurenine formamidase
MPVIWLSHVLSPDTPMYSGSGRVEITAERSIASGDTSNNTYLALPAHSGTHVDAPVHFVDGGASIDQFDAPSWIAERPALIDVPCQPGELIGVDRIRGELEALPRETDMLLLRTGAQRWRTSSNASERDNFESHGPGIGLDLATWLRDELALAFLGVDAISISSPDHREVGREAHRILLGPHHSGRQAVRLIEDMDLAALPGSPHRVWVAPLRMLGGDGAPVTVFAEL